MSSVIQISNLSKIYRLGEIGTGTISRDLERWYKMKVRGQEDPFLKIGQTNKTSEKGISDIVYSLRDINFEVQQGEALGIIGKNGAGKSTLLKILSRVTSPTTGKINIKGRVASLLEVGTGFHPELTGRENIYLNGAILGMRKKEISRKIDEIIDFSGVERYIDTPVKRYSSGMYVRLAFAVAAHLESEILIVDEVLAVGDAEFQKKCLGKMGDISKGEGRTILFVSHNMGAIRNLCNNGILLENGTISYEGKAENVIDKYVYINIDTPDTSIVEFPPKKNKLIFFNKVWLVNKNGILSRKFDILNQILINFEFTTTSNISNSEISVFIINSKGVNVLFTSLSEINDNNFIKLDEGKYHVTLKIKENYLVPDIYNIKLVAHNPNVQNIDVEDKISFIVNETGSVLSRYGESAKHLCCVIGGINWEIKQII